MSALAARHAGGLTILPPDKIAELLLAGVLGLAGTYAGARAAFSWNRRQEQEKVLDAKVEALNRAMHILSRQYSFLSRLRRHHIEPKRNDPYRHFEMLPVVPPVDNWQFTVDVGSLVFLYTTTGKEVPHTYALANEQFESAMQMVDLRYQLHRGEFQQRLKDVHDETPSYYVNHFEVGHSQFEFALNAVRAPTILSQTIKNEASTTGELVLEPELQLLFSPWTAKALIGVLQGQVTAYEARFGPVNERVAK